MAEDRQVGPWCASSASARLLLRRWWIQSVSYVSDKSMFGKFVASSTVAITVGDGKSHEVEFRGVEKARHAHDVILHYVLHE
jgi:hypothetical protein